MILRMSKLLIPLQFNILPKAYYAETSSGLLGGLAKKATKKKTVAAATERTEYPVETDTKKLVKYLCSSNLLKEGGQDIELKPDSEYPNWLWELRTGPAPKLEDLDPNCKEYWIRLRREHRRQMNQKAKRRKF